MIKIFDVMILTVRAVIFNETSSQSFFNSAEQNRINQDDEYVFASQINCLYCQSLIHIQRKNCEMLQDNGKFERIHFN